MILKNYLKVKYKIKTTGYRGVLIDDYNFLNLLLKTNLNDPPRMINGIYLFYKNRWGVNNY